VQTAQALQQQAEDLRRAGVSAGIDLLRAQVELQTRQQELIAARNAQAKQSLVLARAIGLPLDQAFRLADTVPYEPAAVPGIADALALALASRADFRSAQARVSMAEERRRAATAQRLPSLSANADYGVIGPTPGQTHGTFTASAALRIPIFSGNKAHGDELVAQAELDRSRQRLEDLRAQIEQDVRTAALDLQAAADQVSVARSNVDLAQQTLTQSRDRFGAGVSDNIEVVQAQEAVARANESYIASLHDYNLARMQLARATGSAEKEIRQYGKEQ
jgi:outer membrane protein TolC